LYQGSLITLPILCDTTNIVGGIGIGKASNIKSQGHLPCLPFDCTSGYPKVFNFKKVCMIVFNIFCITYIMDYFVPNFC